MGTNSEKIQYDKSSPLQKKLAETDICELSFKEWLIKKQFQMTTTMRRKESKPTFDMLYIIPWLQARAIYTSKQILIKNRVLNFLDAVFICYPNTSIISFTVTEKGGGCVKETFLGCITLFLFFYGPTPDQSFKHDWPKQTVHIPLFQQAQTQRTETICPPRKGSNTHWMLG